jgi:electron transport complex protein RnfB
VIVAAATLATLAAAIGALLLLADRRIQQRADDPVQRIEMLLPRIQCGQCGFAGCTPYAAAVAAGTAAINLCPPGGQETADQLAELLGREHIPLDQSRGSASFDQVALIDEAVCIGCNRCVPACPVDAIIGANHFMHTVIADECTGCELCLAPCPVDCITLPPRQLEPAQ